MEILNYVIAFGVGVLLGALVMKKKSEVINREELKNSSLYNYALEIKNKPFLIFLNKRNELEMIQLTPEDLERGFIKKNGKYYSIEGDTMSLVYKREDGVVYKQPLYFIVEVLAHPQTVQTINDYKFFSLSGENFKKYDELMTQKQFLLNKLKYAESEKERNKLLEKIKSIDKELSKIKTLEKDDQTFYLGEYDNITKKLSARRQGISIDEEIEDLLRTLDI